MENLKLILNEINSDYPIIGSYYVKKLLDYAGKAIRGGLKPSDANNSDGLHLIEFSGIDYLGQHINKSINWASTTNMLMSLTPKDHSNLYVEQNAILLTKSDYTKKETYKEISLNKITQRLENNIVFFGGPGIGKTSLLKKMFLKALEEENIYSELDQFPFLVRLRDVNSIIPFNIQESDPDNKRKSDLLMHQFVIMNHVFQSLGYLVKYPSEFDNPVSFIAWMQNLKLKFVETLDENSLILLIDGFDELESSNLKEGLFLILEDLSLKASSTKFILTSRTGENVPALQKTFRYELVGFNEEQIKEFISNWFENKLDTQQTFERFNNTPYNDTIHRPLILTFLCSLLELNNEIPEKPIDIYEEIIELLIVKWEKENNLTRHSKYFNFTPERKKAFLGQLSKELLENFGKGEYSKEKLQKILGPISESYQFHFSDFPILLQEVESHTGLLIKVSRNTYEFSHLSLQEYLAAKHIILRGYIPTEFGLFEYVPEILAICVSLSSTPNYYLKNLIINFFSKYFEKKNAILLFIRRLKQESPYFEADIELALTIAFLFTGLVTSYTRLDLKNQHSLQFTEDISAEAEKYFFELIQHSKILQDSFILLAAKYKIDYSHQFLPAREHFLLISKSESVKGEFIYFNPENLIISNRFIKTFANNV